jgi:hypothetical protein
MVADLMKGITKPLADLKTRAAGDADAAAKARLDQQLRVQNLPTERVLCLIDGYVNEWPDALEKLKVADFAKRIDLTAHKAHYPAIAGAGINVPAISRLYEVLEGRADR